MHKAITLSTQPPLLPVATLATSQLFHPALPLSLAKVPLQVVFGLSLTFRPSAVHPNAIKQLFTPSLLSMCPDQLHLLLCTSQLISFISTILLFFILCCHLILSIHLKHWHWKLFSFLSLAFVIFLVSQPHIRTGRTKVLNRHTLVLLIPLTAHTCLILC